MLAFPYQPIAPAPQEPNLAVQGRTVFVRSPAGVPTGVFAYSLDGGEPRRFLARPGTQNLDAIETTPQALALLTTSGPPDRVLYGPLNGPLKPLNQDVLNIGLSGSTMLSLEGYAKQRIVARNVNGGPARRIAGPSRNLRYLRAAGPYVSVWNDKGRIIVLNWRTRREVYRVHPNDSGTYVLGADGRIVILGGEFERIQTASAANPHLHTIARVNTAPVLAGDRRHADRLRGDPVALDRPPGGAAPDGKRRAISPRMPLGGDGIDFDGHSVAFVERRLRLRRPGPGGDADRPAAALRRRHSGRSPTTSTFTYSP